MKSRRAGIILSYLYTALNMVCGLFFSSFLLRELGAADYGVYQTVSAFAGYLVMFEFGTGTVMTRNLLLCRNKNAEKEEIDRNISTILVITLVLSVIILLVSAVFYFNFNNIYANSMTQDQIAVGKQMFVVITVYLVVSFITQSLDGIILAYENYTYQSLISIAKLILRTVFLIMGILIFQSALVITVVDCLLSLLVFLYTAQYCVRNYSFRFSISSFDFKILRASLPLCCAVFLQTLVNQANNNVDKFIIGIKMTPELVSVYSIGYYVYSVFSSLSTIPVQMYTPQISKSITNGLEGKDLTNTLIQPCRLVALIGGTVLFGFISVGRSFIAIVYGNDYLEAYIIAVIIMIPMFIDMTAGILVNVLNLMDKRLARSVTLLFTTVANVLLTVIWVDKWGIAGAAVATAICTLVGQDFIMNIYYSRVIGIKVFYLFKQAYSGILVFQIIGTVCSLLTGGLFDNAILSFLVGGITYVLVMFLCFMLWGANEAERKVISSLKCRILGRFHR